MPSPADLLRDVATAFLLVLIVISWSAGSLVSAFAAPLHDRHLEASSAPDQPVGADAALGQGQLDAAAASAKADWQAARPSADLSGLTFSVADLGGLQLGDEAGTAITVDVDAAGWGWSQMDLGTVVRHEIGHALGLPHGSGLMGPTLSPGESFGVGAEYAEAAPETSTDQPAESSEAGATGGSDTAAGDGDQTSGSSSTSSDTSTGGADDSTSGTTTEPTGSTDSSGSTGTTGSTGPDTSTSSGDQSADAGSDTGPADETVTESLTSSVSKLQSFAAPTSFSLLADPTGTAGADVFTIVDNGGGSYDVMLGGVSIGTVSGTDTFTIDGLEGLDTLVAPDLAGLWKITKINEGSYQVVGGPTFEFTHVENLTGAATAVETYRFSDQAGVTGLIDDGSGQLTLSLGGFVVVTGFYDFVQEAKDLKVVGSGVAAATKSTNVLKVGGHDGQGFVGAEQELPLVGMTRVGLLGTLGQFALAVVTAIDESGAWQMFDGTITSPTFVAPAGISLSLAALSSVSIGMNAAAEDGTWLDLVTGPSIVVDVDTATTRTLHFSSLLVSATLPVRIDLDGFLYIAGNVTISRGTPAPVDIVTGLTETTGSPLTAIHDLTAYASDEEAAGRLGRSVDYASIWNLPVSSLEFAFTNATFFAGSGFAWNGTDAPIDRVDVPSGAFGLFGGGLNLGFVLLTPLAGTPINKRFLGLTGYVEDIHLFGLEDYLTLDIAHLAFTANSGGLLASGAVHEAVVDWAGSFPVDEPAEGDPIDPAVTDPTPAGYHIFVGGLDPPELYLDSSTPAFALSAQQALITISEFVLIGGSFSLEKGATEYVDITTEDLTTLGRQALVDGISNVQTSDPGGQVLARNATASQIWNLPVSTVKMGIDNGSIFIGYNPGGFADGITLPFLLTDLDEDAVGFFATGISVGLVSATPSTTLASLKLPSFFALRAGIVLLKPVGLPEELNFYLEGISLEVNRGGVVGTAGATNHSLAYVDWVASFPGTGGLAIATGSDDSVLIDFDDPVIGVKADLVVLSISDFVHISGGFSLVLGGREKVDVRTGGLTSVQGNALGTTVGNEDEGDGTVLAAEADGSVVYNLPVRTTMIGISNGSIFIGYNPKAPGDTGTSFDISGGTNANMLDLEDLSPDAIGFFATGINAAFVLAAPDKPALPASAFKSQYTFGSFFAMKATIAYLAPVGIPADFGVLTFENVTVSVNSGRVIKRSNVALTAVPSAPKPTSYAFVDWAASFPDTGGLEVPTSSSTSVLIDYDNRIVGVSASRLTFAISEFVFIQGGFAFEKGSVYSVDVRTSGLPLVAGGLLETRINGVGSTPDPTDPAGNATRASNGATRIWDLPISTVTIGVSNARIFVGYDPGHAPGASFATNTDGNFLVGADAVGLLATGIQVAVVLGKADPGAVNGYEFSTFVAVSAYIETFRILGIPAELNIHLDGIALAVNTGGAVKTGSGRTATPITGSKAVVDWASSFPDTDGADNPLTTAVEGGPLRAGLAVATGNDPIYIDLADDLIGFSATKVTIAISDFVFVQGGFAFQKVNGNTYVDVHTSGLLTGTALATTLNAGTTGSVLGFDEDPAGDDTRATRNATTIWDVPVTMTMLGISNASIFIGYNPNAPGTTGTSFDVSGGTDPNLLDEGDLSAGAVGLLANGINLGLVIAKLAAGAPAALKALNFSSFIALRGTINLLTPVGLPDDLVFRFEGVGVSLNLGKQIGTIPNSKAWIDWSASFPELTNPDGSVAKPPGLLVPTGTGNVPILIDFEDPIIGVEAKRVTISIIDFVHIAGGFAFEKGSTETVTIKTGASNSGVTGLAECAALQGTLATAKLADTGSDWELSTDCKTITDVGIDVIKLGVYNASLFLGWNPTPVGSLPFADVDSDGVLDRTELADGAIGFLASGVTLGFVVSSFTPSALATALGNPKFYTVKAHADFLGLVGLEDDFVLEAENAHIEANLGSKWTTLPNSKASIDWADSFEDGYEVETGGDNPSVVMDYDGYLIAGGVSKFTLQISEFVYLAGSFYFEYGDTIDAPTTAALIDVSLLGQLDPTGTLADYVGCPSTDPDCTKPLQVMTIGAENVSAFVGAGGPYWVDTDEDGLLDDDEINHDAVGLVLADVDFALALFTPVDPLDPTRYIALQASAGEVALVGVEGLTASGKGINIELNISTPSLSGFPVLPVIDFAAYARRNCNDTDPCTEEPFGVKIAAPDSITGDAPTKDFTYDSLLVKASVADLDIDVFGVLAIRGSVALELGPRADLTLTNGSVVTGATTLKLGGANLLGFVGIDGPSWTEDTDGNVVWVDAVGDPCTPGPLTDCQIVRNTSAVGLEINDLDFAIFLGVKTDLANPAVYVAADVRVDSFGLVGLPSGFTAGGVLAISLNVGVGLTGLGGVNFKTTFGSTDPDGDNETAETADTQCTTANPSTSADPDCDNAQGLWIPTGNPDNPMLLDFTKTFVTVELAGTITIGSYAALVGLFYLDVSEDGLKALVLADLRIGPDIGAPKPLLKAGAIGVLVIDSLGVAADLTVDLSIGNPDVGLELSAKARVLLNTRAADATLEIPDTLWGFLTGLKNGVSPTGGALPAGLTSPGAMTTIFLSRLRDCETPDADDGSTDDNRCYVISGKAPKLISAGVVDSGTINALLGTGTVNTDATAGAYVTVVLNAGFTVVGFASGEGLVGISLRASAFEMVIDVTFVVGSSSNTGLNVRVAGLVGLYSDGIFLDVAVSIRANLMSLFDLDVSGRLTLDSTTHDGTARDSYFHLVLDGNVRVLKVVTLNGHLDIAVSDSKWAVSASLSARFGPISLHADGFILSTGSFAFNLGGGIDLTIAGTGIEGYVTAHVSFCNRTGTGSQRQTCLDQRDPTSTAFGVSTPDTRTFLIGFGGGVDVKLFGITLAGADIFFSGEAGLDGRITVRARFSVKILFIRKSVTITIADFYLPVRLVNEGAVPPKLATLSGGVLTLNVGDRANLREVRKTATQEDYIIKSNGGGSFTIYALGEEETFTGVTSIVGDFGSDDDSFVAFNDLNVTTTLHGGADNDFLAYSGSGCVTGATQATLHGDGGDDDLRGGSCADALYGGAGNDYLDGGAGLDVLEGADGDDVFAGYLANSAGETVRGGTGNDVFELIATPGADTIGLVASGTAVNVTSGSGNLVLDSFEDLTLRTQGGDNVTINGDLNTAGIRTVDLVFGSSYIGPNTDTVCDRSTAASAASASCTDTKTFLGGTDTVTLNLASGVDTLNIRGGQEPARPVLSRGSGALQVTNVLGDIADNVATTHVVWVGHFELIASGSSLATGDRDELVINTLGGDDAIRVTSLATSTTVNGGIGDDSFKVGSNALASNTNGTVNAVVAPLVITGGDGTDSLDVDDAGDTAANTGTLTHALLTGLGLHAEGIAYTGIETLGVTLGSGADTFTVVSTSSITTTTIHAGPGNDVLVVKTVSGPTLVFGDADHDTVTVGSQGSAGSGVLDQILAFLRVSGGAGTDAVTLDDTADSTGDIGYVTDGRVAGLGMIVDAGHTAANPAWSVTILNATGGSWALTVRGTTVAGLAFDAKAKIVQDALNSALGGSFVTVTRSPVTRLGGTTYLIRWVGSFTGAPPTASINASALTASSGSASGALGTMTSGYIDYDSFETFTLGLGSGGDFLDVDSTQTGTTGSTTVNAGGGDDVLTVETTSGPTTVNAQAGDDVLMVNPLPNATSANGLAGGTTRTGNVLTLDGGAGSDTFVVAVFNTGDSLVDVRDVLDGASNVLQVDGTAGNDVFVLRSGVVAAVNTPLTGTTGIQRSFGHAELVTYSNTINTGLVVNGLDGDDVVAMDDNSTSTTVNGGAGADSFYVGQLYGDTVHFDLAYRPVLTDTTRGMLTRGVSYATTINGGTGNDLFSILRNVAALQLYGEDGDDTFVLRTFLLEADPTSDAVSKVSTGSGADLVSYVINAPVAVDGGDGFDTLVVIGTEADDIFVISKDGIWGAGRFVSFVGIEKADVDGAEGDDFFYVVSTGPTVQTRIFGGLGSDMTFVGSAAPLVVADDLQGHSGLVQNSVETSLGAWQNLPVDGIAAEITDNDEPAVAMTPTGSGTLVKESGATDSYVLTLAKAPTGTVSVTVSAPLLSPDDEDARRRTVLVSLTGTGGWARSVTAVFDATHLSRTIYVMAIDDLALESDRYVVLQHLVVQNDGTREYDGLPIANAVVRVVDNDLPAVTVVADAPVRVVEGGPTGSYQLSLSRPLSGAATVTVRVSAGPQTRVSLTGAAGTWVASIDVVFHAGDGAITVHVQGIDDATVEGTAFDTITQTVSASTDGGYVVGMAVDPVSVLVDDDDTPSVRVTETDGGTHVVEAGDTDFYWLALDRNPCLDAAAGTSATLCTVTVRATALQTGTRDGATIRNDVQLELSTDGTTYSSSVAVTFNGTNWSTQRKIWVRAVNDSYIDGSDYQAFASTSISRVNQIQGPLAVFGGKNPDASYELPAPYMLPGETSDALVTTPNAAFDVIEANQVDTLVVDNGNDVAAETGTLTSDHLTGLGLGGDRTIGGRTIAGGITYDDLENLVVKLGKGQDTFTVLSTHAGRTEITGGSGNDVFAVRTIGGVTRVAGDAGDDTFTVGDAGLLDHLGSLLVLAGGAGNDTALLDDSAETANQLATITQGTVTGLDMVGNVGLDRIYSLTVRGAGPFTITVNGRTTGLLAATVSAAALQETLQSMLFPTAACGLAAGDSAGSTPARDSRCAQSVYVWKDGSTYLIGFTGELAGTVPTFSSTMTDLARPDGVNYSELEDLTVNLGSGNDGVNVRGTTASTHVNTGAGDDLVFVSDAANLGNVAGVLNAVDLSHLLAALTTASTTRDVEALFAAILHQPLSIDDITYLGSLDLVTGALSIDTGAGSNTLAVSDRFDPDADLAFTITDSAISGLAPATITYASTGGDLAGQGHWTRQADSGLFGRGISVFLGQGGNAGRIASVRGGALGSTPYAATLTTVWAGEGADNITIGANLPTAGAARLVVHGQHGNDSIVADAAATQPLVLIGDEGSDTLRGGAGDDIVIGDSGRVYSLRPTGALGYDLVLGGAPLAGDLTNPRTLATATGDGVFLTADVIRTSTTGIGTGDSVSGRAGNDVLLGGDGADGIDGEAGNDVAAGDYAWWDTIARELVSLGLSDTHGGNDTITGDVGDDLLVGGNGSDTVTAGTGDDWVLGDFGWVNLTTRVLQTLNAVGVTGANDVLVGNDGDDVLAGGVGGDTISGDAGNDWVIGDFGAVDALNRELHSTDLTVLNGGGDSIAGGTGADVVLAGNGADVVNAGDGNDLVFGDFGSADLAHGVLASTNDAAATGGDDRLHGDADDDILVGGNLADTIWGDAGDDLVFGDFGQVTSRSSSPIVFTDLPLSVPLANHSFDFVSIFTTATSAGDDVVSGGTGNDIVLGQQGRDLLTGDDGDDDLIGGHNVAGGSDAGDTILGGTGHDVVVGDNGSVLRTGSSLTTQVRVLLGGRLYTLVGGTYFGGSIVGAPSANPSNVETRAIALFDHGQGTGFEGRYGVDTITGGDGDDVLFGQLGNDSIQAGAGTDYVEGNGGADTIYGGLGQDDLIGGSSDLFGLDSVAKRPDGRDTIYGGDGPDASTLAVRNAAGDLTAAGHANDADVILGDNGRIFKMVGGLNGGFLSFTYDTATTKVVPRTVVLLDYTPTGDCGQYSLVGTDRARPTLVQGSCTNVGGGDFLHGEGGDDVIHGMSGDDALYGDGQDDDLYGEAGNDWISGGAGQDGIVGDDGLVLTSRNGSLETLNYVDVRTASSTVAGNGPHHSAVINVAGTLLKAVDLEPFYVGWNDVLYGGLGSDFVHGGEGDDAISGGEALAAYYTTDPLATLATYYIDNNPLQFGFRDPEEFRYYNENDPMRLVKVCPTGSTTNCLPFLTTADETGNDGDDALFGDGGNDWMSGGTGVDHLYGGWGHDLLDVDDDKTTMNGANSKVDNDSFADYAFGGAGRDVLIGNTKSDRLIDWIGEFNSYLVPFNQFGASTVWRASAPAVRQFLYDLSKADGADQTRAPGNVRNGEPYGELGLTSSEDAEWGDQHGAPDDPQPGNGGTFSSATALAAPTGTTAYAGTTGSTTTTTTFAKASTTTTTTASTAKIASASVVETKKGGTLTVTLSAKTTVNVRIAVVVVGLDEVARLVTTTTVWAGATSITGTYALGMVSGGQYEFAWMPSTDPAKSDLVLVIRQIA